MENKKYLVRPHDSNIFELDETNGCYRTYDSKVTYTDGSFPNAQLHFTYENLTKNYDFFPIEFDDIEIYKKKNNEYHKYINWRGRPDGHGGGKGGTMTEYLEYIKNK